MSQTPATKLSPAKRKRMLKTYGSCPAGYTHQDLERFLDLLYGLYSDLYTPEELRRIIVSDPFDRTEPASSSQAGRSGRVVRGDLSVRPDKEEALKR